MRSGHRLTLTFALLLAIACGSPAPTDRAAGPAASPLPSQLPAPSAPSASPSPSARPHVFVIVMENTSLVNALGSPSIARLASTYALAANYHSVAKPSLPNYLALTSGSTWGVSDDDYRALPAGGIGAQLSAAGVRWRAYMEGLTVAGCIRSPRPYAVKHNPFAYYGGGCPANVVPFEALDVDLAGDTPSFVWITPDLCHDGHDCDLIEAGPWLEGLIARIVASNAWREHGVIFVVWDEGDDAGRELVPLIVVTPGVTARRSGERYDHYSLLATVEDLFRLERLGNAAAARPLTDLLSPRTP